MLGLGPGIHETFCADAPSFVDGPNVCGHDGYGLGILLR